MNIKYSLFALVAVATMAQADVAQVTDVEAKYSNKNSVEASNSLKQNINLGFSTTKGNSDTLDVNGKYDASFITTGYAGKELKVGFDASAYFTENNNTKSNEEFLINLGLEQMVYDGWLGYAGVNWLNNPVFKNYDSKTSIGLGVGKELYNNGQHTVLVKLGTSYNIENYANAQATDEYGALNEYVEYHNTINEVSNVYVKAGAMQNFDDMSNDYEAVGIFGLNVAVAQSVSLTLEAEIDYDNTPAIGFKKKDAKTIARLGYNF